MFASLTGFLKTLASHPGQAYRDLFPVVLIATAAVVVLHLVIVLCTRRATPVPRVRWNWWERLIYLVMVVAIADLAATAFYTVYRYDAMSGWALFAHMGGSGALILALPLIALTWAEANGPDHRALSEPDARETLAARANSSGNGRFFWLTKLTFWVILAQRICDRLHDAGQYAPLVRHRRSGTYAGHPPLQWSAAGGGNYLPPLRRGPARLGLR